MKCNQGILIEIIMKATSYNFIFSHLVKSTLEPRIISQGRL